MTHYFAWLYDSKSQIWLLHNRKQFVMYNNVKSNIGKIDYGVPQGSIVGPLLFLQYINDICNVSNQISCTLFADDTNIFATGRNLAELTNMLNTELAKINNGYYVTDYL